MLRRMVLTMLLGLAAARSDAGDLYYRTLGDPNGRNIYAVNENGGTPRVVLHGSEYPLGSVAGMTRFNHVGSNGQALVQARPFSAPSADIQLVFREANGQVTTRPVTDLEGEELSPYGPPVLAQDDRFFSFQAHDGVGRSTIWRLNVTVDEALAAGYAPPTSFDDPRLQLVVDDPTNGTENHGHTWNPDGTRLAYLDRWADAGGVEWNSIRMKSMFNGSIDPISHPRILDTPQATSTWGAMLQWSPVSNQILNASQSGNAGIWACYADSPGVMTWVARPLTKTSKNQTVKEEVWYPLWRPDGRRIACAYTKHTTTKYGTTREQQPAVMAPTGWPVVKLLSWGTTLNPHIPLGWTP